MRLVALLSTLLLVGCPTTQVIHEKPTEGLSGAERELDSATDARLSKIAASVKVSSALLWEELDEDSDPALKAVQSELEIAEMLAGIPKLTDEQEAIARLTLAKNGDGVVAYATAKKEVERLNAIIRDADRKYEAEKAKQKAAYAAQLEAKEMEIKAAEEARINDRFLAAGAVLLLVGVALLFSPAKTLGATLALLAVVLGATPLIRNEPWFGYAIGGFVGLVLLTFLWIAVKANKKNPPCDAPANDSSPDNPL